MIQTLTANWWLLALCGVFDATASALYFIMQNQDGPVTFHAWRGTILFLGALILAAGACTMAAGLWRSAKGKCWLLVLNGLALIALALIYEFLVRYRVSFLTVALLIILMAVSAGILELTTARTLLRQRSRCRRMVAWHCRHGLGWFRGGISCLGASLDYRRTGIAH